METKLDSKTKLDCRFRVVRKKAGPDQTRPERSHWIENIASCFHNNHHYHRHHRHPQLGKNLTEDMVIHESIDTDNS